MANVALGGKVYEYDKKELLNQFDRLTEKEVDAITREIKSLKRQIKKDPEKRKQNMKDIKLNYELLKKAKREAVREKRRARKAF